MKPDLQNLLISKKAFKAITGIEVAEVEYIRKINSHKFALKRILNRSNDFLIQVFTLILFFSLTIWALAWIAIKAIHFIVVVQSLSWSLMLKLSLCISIPLALLTTYSRFKNINKRKTTWKCLISLFEDFEKYNQILQAINVKDQLEEVGSIPPDIEGREALLQTLADMKQDLVRALKTERILRDNSGIVNLNTELFETSFAAIRVEQINLQGNEYSQLVSETLKIGMSIRNEMKNMQTEASS